ncbi:MAG: hypothetical protein JWQ39_1247 [Glaciihabitans sp.]|jgi:hypothetical protein|nr:hypothetical protein [Glaciihabitans sp.]
MSTLRYRVTVPVAIVVALATAPLLTGCFGNPIQGLVKNATGGKVDLGGTSIPADFPSVVPVYKGKVDSALSLGSGKKKIWNVSVEVPDANAMNEIKSELSGAGFTTDLQGNIGKVGASLISDNKTYGVAVVLAKSDKGFIANYTVTPDAASN